MKPNSTKTWVFTTHKFLNAPFWDEMPPECPVISHCNAPIWHRFLLLRLGVICTCLPGYSQVSRQLLAQAIAFTLVQVSPTLWQLVAQPSDVVVRIDVGSTCFEASDILLRRLLPISLGPCLGEADPDPRNRRLVQQKILQLPRLHGCIFWWPGARWRPATRN